MTPVALSLTDHQMSLVRRAAGALRPAARDQFLQAVAKQLGDEPTDHAVTAAIGAALGRQAISHFMLDSATQRGRGD